MKKVLPIFFCILFFLVPQKAFALETASAESDVTYQILSDTLAHVTFNIVLTNTTSQYYTAKYTIAFDFDNIDNVRVTDPDGAITADIIKSQKGYTVEIPFNKKVVGIGKKLPFTIQFDTTDVVQRKGTAYEVNIPYVSQSEFIDYNVHVRVPPYFGKPLYIKPDTGTGSMDFTKDQLKDSAVTMEFGEEQFYEFSLIYHLRNAHIFPTRTEIALPPETSYQDVFIKSIEPKPLNVSITKDGNWMALYSLGPSRKLDVTVKGNVRLHLIPRRDTKTLQELAKSLVGKKYWEVSDPKVVQLATSLKTPKAIYDFVQKTLQYDVSRLTTGKERIGAKAVLENPSSAICLEFTDLFVTLARASGIPARYVDGYAYTNNLTYRPLLSGNLFHAWPQYYDREKQTWIMVDPTWANTTRGMDYFSVFDRDHIALSIKGEESDYPLHAGDYIYQDPTSNKDVVITPSMNQHISDAKAKGDIQISKISLAGVPIKGVVRLTNTGETVFPTQELVITSDVLSPKKQQKNTPAIPPFGYADIPFVFEKTGIFTHKRATINVTIGGATMTEHITVTPFTSATFYTNVGIIILGGVVLASAAIIIYIIAKRSGSLSFFR